jgi:hypothetical protein
MSYSSAPNAVDLPSSQQLRKSTITAAIVAAVLLVTVVLPAEYSVDPTGIGKVLGLKKMGEIKTELAKEAEADRVAAAQASQVVTPDEQAAVAVPTASATVATSAQVAEDANAVNWRDEKSFVLKPGEGVEIKLKMNKGDLANFQWRAQGGVVNYDTHGDAPGQSISYEKGRGVASADGNITAAFDGNHGWFWRNRESQPVTVTLRTKGAYTSIKRM